MKRAILLRHGRTRANDEYIYCGSTDLPLSEQGRAALEQQRRQGGYPSLEGFRVYTSGMKRTEETLAVLYGDIAHDPAPDMREVDFGIFELHSYEELKDTEPYRKWCDGDNERNVPPGGESGAAMAGRVLRCFAALCAEEGDFCVITHGGPIACLMAHLFPEEEKNRYQWQPRNGEGYLLELDEDHKNWKIIPERSENDG